MYIEVIEKPCGFWLAVCLGSSVVVYFLHHTSLIGWHQLGVYNELTLARKYCSTFYVGMGQIQNGRLYLRYIWDQLCDNHRKVSQNTYGQKSLLYYCLKYPKSSAISHRSWEKQTFLFCYPSFFFAHNSKTIGCIWTFYMLNECSTTGEVPFLG